MRLSRDFLKFFMIPVILLIGIGIASGFTYFYSSTSVKSDGTVVNSNWPKNFTQDFEEYLSLSEGGAAVSEQGLSLLRENNLWIQILDQTGKEVYSYDKPSDIADSYLPYELLERFQNRSGKDSVFIGSKSGENSSYTYLIGFPMSIEKIVAYVDTARYNSSKVLIVSILAFTALLLIGITIFYNTLISRHMRQICEALQAVASREYKGNMKSSFLSEIYEGIELLNQDIKAGDMRREQDEKAKQEWLANITHDLKTPLAPIRGYAEMLMEEEEHTEEQIRNYGRIILKNTLYTEGLVDDLKLTYQLQSNMLPLRKEKQCLSRLVKEIIIDLLNSPDYEERLITFEGEEDVITEFDSGLLRRALTNVLVNALKYNDAHTAIDVSVLRDGGIKIIIEDHGCGMTDETLKGLFQRYYRGTSTEASTEGTGLGMAIAKQIVEAHGGTILVSSIVNQGTTVEICMM